MKYLAAAVLMVGMMAATASAQCAGGTCHAPRHRVIAPVQRVVHAVRHVRARRACRVGQRVARRVHRRAVRRSRRGCCG